MRLISNAAAAQRPSVCSWRRSWSVSVARCITRASCFQLSSRICRAMRSIVHPRARSQPAAGCGGEGTHPPRGQRRRRGGSGEARGSCLLAATPRQHRRRTTRESGPVSPATHTPRRWCRRHAEQAKREAEPCSGRRVPDPAVDDVHVLRQAAACSHHTANLPFPAGRTVRQRCWAASPPG